MSFGATRALALLALLTAAASPAAAQARRIVVLGSSTAAGAGPTWPDSAWVPRYRTYALGVDPSNEVVNLAVGGFTTYHVQPTGSIPPSGRPAPDPAHNITAALALHPDAVIVNLPSNDAAQGYTVSEQLSNYDALRIAAGGVPLWISTTQPRNLGEAGRANLRAMRDSISARYAPRVLDFWTTLARPDGTIEPIFDSGDGIHLNSPAHRILFERVVAARVLGETPTEIGVPLEASAATVRALPNPFRGATMISLSLPTSAHARVTVHDVLGRVVQVLADAPLHAGDHFFGYSPAVPASAYLVRAEWDASFETLVLLPLR